MSHPLRILFASSHGYFDPSSGAALATRDLLEGLNTVGWECGVLCGPLLDFEPECDRNQFLESIGVKPTVVRSIESSLADYQLFQSITHGVRSVIFEPDGWIKSRKFTEGDHKNFLKIFQYTIEWFSPDLVVTYGGNAIDRSLMLAAKKSGCKVVFALHNFAYNNSDAFKFVDNIFVPTRYAQREYAKRGIITSVLPCPVLSASIRPDRVYGKFVTFVNPVPAKGVFVVARIMKEMATRRPDIHFLVVESRGAINWLGRCGVDLTGVSNVYRMANTNQPSEFYAQSRIVIMPSLWQESLGRVAVESLLNGIPVVASNRGALPEVLGDAGKCLSIPDNITPESRTAPSALDIKPWCDEIERLWDDQDYHEEHHQRSLIEAAKWQPEKLTSSASSFLRWIHEQI